jgi:hypothetical protein
MRRPVRIAITLAVLGATAAAAVASAAVIPIYSNEMATTAARSQIVRFGGGECSRGGGGEALKVTIGERTRECQYRSPVVGTNVDIKATARLLSGTPDSMQARTFIAVGVRDGAQSQYQLAVFPKKGSFQLRRDDPSNGATTLLANGKSGAVKEVGRANKLRLQAFPTPGGETRLTAFVNSRKVASVIEDAHTASTVTGQFSTLSVGSNKAANGATASFDDLTVAVPDPF